MCVILNIGDLFMNKLRSLLLVWAIALNGWDGTAQQIADVFWVTSNTVNSGDDSLKCNVNSIKMYDLKDEWKEDNSGREGESKFQLEASIEAQSCLYDNFTFEKYSDNPWVHFLGSAVLPICENTNISLFESVYYTPEKDNPTNENNITDLVVSHNVSDKFSVDGWLQFSQYLNQKGSNMFSVYVMLNYSPNDKFSVSNCSYKPLLLGWEKASGFYFLNTFEYKMSDNKEFLLRTMTSCADNWKTLFWLGFASSLWDNLSVEFTTIPDKKTWIIPEWVQWTLRYKFKLH